MAVSLLFKSIKFILNKLASAKRNDFIEACKNPMAAQELVLSKILENSLHPMPYSPVTYNFYEKRKILTHEPVKFFETTSGSTGNKKQIPYTNKFLKTFEDMFLIWAHDLISDPELNIKFGKFFMSVSPKIGDKKDDTKYLSWPVTLLLTPFLASNPNFHFADTADEFLLEISRDLLNCRKLEIISIWSPTYLLSVLSFMRKHEIALHIEHKTWQDIWPHLKLISCWTDAQASKPSQILKSHFPGVRIQGKGLLMTEGAVTVPWLEAGGCVPLINQVYLEFQDESGKLLKIHEIEEGKTYTLITSQMNGFLRYNTKDRVKVTGLYYMTPMLEFVGREDQYSDLAGEKLSEAGLRSLDVQDHFLVLPDDTSELPQYHIVSESDLDWDHKLKAIYHYKLARDLGQLKSPIVHVVKDVNALYLRFFQTQGMALGDIKERILINDLTLARKFLAWMKKEHSSFAQE